MGELKLLVVKAASERVETDMHDTQELQQLDTTPMLMSEIPVTVIGLNNKVKEGLTASRELGLQQ